MKLNTLFVAAVCAGTLLSSCVDRTARENQLKYTHTTLVDGDAYAIFQIVGETALSGVQYAERAESTEDAKSKEVAAKLKAFYEDLIPSMDTIATAFQIDFPIKGIPALDEEHASSAASHTHESDSTLHAVAAHADHDHHHGHSAGYVEHAQHELATVKKQLGRLSHNTNKDLQVFAKKYLASASDLYTAIGGKEEEHGHH